jgi:beta-glucosidase
MPALRFSVALCGLLLIGLANGLSDAGQSRLQCAEQRAAAAAKDFESAKLELEQARAGSRSPSDDDVEATVAKLLVQLTVPEKARQLDIFRTADMLTNGVVNMTKAKASWGDLSLGFGVMHDVYAYPEIFNDMMREFQDASRLKIPPIFGGEATHGLQQDDHTIFPSPITLASTFDVNLMKQYGQVVGSEARASGVHVTWAPVLGLCREPRWGRCEEMMGEDPFLVQELGRASITGLNADGVLNATNAVGPLMKHYAAYSVPEGGHNTAPVHMGKRELLSTFIPPFAAGMEAGAQAMMVSYNEIDGEPNAGSDYMLTQIPRNNIGGNGPKGGAWDGYVSSDFGAINNLRGVHAVAKDIQEAVAQYIIAGGSVQGFDFSHQEWMDAIVYGVGNLTLPMDALDLAVARVLRVKARLGLMTQPYVQNPSQYYDLIKSKAHSDVALAAARKAMVLLQNLPDKATAAAGSNGTRVLPLDATKIKTMALLGPNGDQLQCGDYTAGGSWGSDGCGGGPVNNERSTSILGGIKAVAPHVKVTYRPGVPVSSFNATAPYFTTIQQHSFTTLGGEQGITGTYYNTTDLSGPAALSRNDFLISMHLLNYGPDPHLLPASAFSARFEGWITPDCTVSNAQFKLLNRAGSKMTAKLWIDNISVPLLGKAASVVLVQGQRKKLVFEYSQEDSTGEHPSFALQWSLQGQSPLQEALDAANQADVIVCAVGGATGQYGTSGEGIDRSSLGLPGNQLAFLQAVRQVAIKRKVPMAVTIVQGRPLSEQWMKQSLPAILEAWQAGQAQGIAIAETLFGINNPAGRTAVSFAQSADVLPVFYNRHPSASRGGYNNPPLIPGGLYPPSVPSSSSVLWAFGHGESYGAVFNYSKLKITPAIVPINGTAEVTLTIKNNGTLPAEEVVQLYVRDELASVTTPVMQLRGFQRLAPIAPNESRDVVFKLVVQEHLWLINHDLSKVVEPGSFKVMVGGASDAIEQTAGLCVEHCGSK